VVTLTGKLLVTSKGFEHYSELLLAFYVFSALYRWLSACVTLLLLILMLNYTVKRDRMMNRCGNELQLCYIYQIG
jgi:heme exporter protein D